MTELIQFELPETCPYCGTKLEFDGTHLICPNSECKGKAMYKFIDAISLLKIKGAGPAMLESWFEAGITDPFAIFDNNEFRWSLEHSRPLSKNEEKVIKAIEKIKSIDLQTVIMMMGYKNMGKSTAKQIANKVSGVKYDFSGLEKEVVSGWDEDEEKRKALEENLDYLAYVRVEVVFPQAEAAGSKGLEFTGSPKPEFATKGEFEEYIKKFGFKHTSLKDAVMLVTDSYDSTSSKMKTAEKKGIEIITYSDFVKRFN